MENVLQENFLGTLSFVRGELSFVDTVTYFLDAGGLILRCDFENGPKSLSFTESVKVSFVNSKNSVMKNHY